MHEDNETRAARIAGLNDRLRRSGLGGQVVVTAGVMAEGPGFIHEAMRAVRAFDAFTEDNDPCGERDFGSVEVGGKRLLWKVDYHDRALAQGSPDPADPTVTTRVLTVLLAEEY